MPIILEAVDSRSGERGEEKQSFSLKYTVQLLRGESDLDGIALVDSITPLTLDELLRQSIRFTPRGARIIEFEVPYSNEEPKEPEKKPGDGEFQFDTTGAREKIYYSKETIARCTVAGGTAPDFKGGINVTKSSVEGVDVVMRRFKFSVNVKIPIGRIRSDYITTLFELTGTVNEEDPFKITYRGVALEFKQRELLFEGARGSQSGKEAWEIGFHFEGSKTEKNLSIGNGTVGNVLRIPGGRVLDEKKGHDYVWCHFEDRKDADAKQTVQVPTSAHVERVYDMSKFKKLGLS